MKPARAGWLHVSCHMTEHGERELWALVYGTMKPKVTDPSPNACLNRLVRERISGRAPPEVNEMTATIQREFWTVEQLQALERKHERVNDENDNRPLVVVKYSHRKLLIDGNHRVNRWLAAQSGSQREVLVIEVK